MTTDAQFKSIHDLEPLESGGEVARDGFEFQDHVAASFYLLMAENDALREVWCETHDDITLIWQRGQHQEIEFVQVKNNDLNQLWSVALLCKREAATAAEDQKKKHCILEKSLANDRCREACSFRIVTSVGVKKELNALKLPLDHQDRKPTTNAFRALLNKVSASFDVPPVSMRKNGVSFWLQRTHWDTPGNTKSVEASNLCTLDRVLDPYQLATDHRTEIYQSLLAKARLAGVSKWKVDPAKKKVSKDGMASWLRDRVNRYLEFRQSPSLKTLKKKVDLAKLPDDYFRTAKTLRSGYRKLALSGSQFLDLSPEALDAVVGAVSVALQDLRVRLDRGELAAGAAFHEACLDRLKQLGSEWRHGTPPPEHVLRGCMYDLASRCVHRFHMAEP